MYALETINAMNARAAASVPEQRYRISRDRNFKVGDRVRSYDFPHDKSHRNCYVEGYIVGDPEGYEQRVAVDVVIDMQNGSNMSYLWPARARKQVLAPTGRGLFFNRHCLFKLEEA